MHYSFHSIVRPIQATACTHTGAQGPAEDSAALLLLAQDLTSLLGTAGQSVVHKLSQAHCQWAHLPANRSDEQAERPDRSALYLPLVCPPLPAQIAQTGASLV